MQLPQQILLTIDPEAYHSRPPPAYRPRPDDQTSEKLNLPLLHQVPTSDKYQVPPIRPIDNASPPLPCIHCINMMKNENSEKSTTMSEDTVTSEKVRDADL